MLVISLITIFLTSNSFAGNKHKHHKHHKHHELEHFVGKQLVLNAKGTATAFLCDIPATEIGTTQALCFNVPLYNFKTGKYVGIATDRLADNVFADNGGFQTTVTTTFKFTKFKHKPSITTRLRATVQPFLGTVEGMTHLTGYIPSAGHNDILYGTKRFQHLSGTTRESGAIDLTNFQGLPGDEVVFDLVWVITLD